IDFLVFVRNKTRGHGAKKESFYDNTCDALSDAVLRLIASCPITTVKLGFRIPTRFDECLWLSGLAPSGRSKMPDAAKEPSENSSMLFLQPDDLQTVIYMPAL